MNCITGSYLSMMKDHLRTISEDTRLRIKIKAIKCPSIIDRLFVNKRSKSVIVQIGVLYKDEIILDFGEVCLGDECSVVLEGIFINLDKQITTNAS